MLGNRDETVNHALSESNKLTKKEIQDWTQEDVKANPLGIVQEINIWSY